MCGIVGAINLTAKLGQDFMTQALYADAVRGWDSTGLVAIRKGRAEYYKRALSASDFINTRAFKRLVTGEAEAFIGHNRAATIGAVTDSTAHPFIHEHIVGVHNGTLDFGWRSTMKDGNKFAVDSDALIYNIAHEGIEETVRKASGAFAIVYYDMKEHTLNIIRNKERPMYYGILNYKAEDKWVFGSEAGLIEWIAERCDNGDPLKEVWELKEGNLLTFDLNDAGSAPSTKKMEVAGRSASSTPFRGGSTQNSWNSKTYNGRKTPVMGTRAPVVYMPSEKKLFEKHGIDADEPVEFWPLSFEPYANSSQGMLRGMMCDAPHIEVIVYNIRGGVLDMAKVHSALVVTVRAKAAARAMNQSTSSLKPNNLEVVLSTPTIVEVPDVPNPLINHDNEEDKDDEEKTHHHSTGSKYLGPTGKILSRVEFDDATREGCSCCSSNLIYGVDRVYWTVDAQPLCEECHMDLTRDAING